MAETPVPNTIANINAEIATNLASGSGITAVRLRQTLLDAVASLSPLSLLATYSASNVASLADTVSLTTTYDVYRFEFIDLIPATNNVQLQLLVGGVTDPDRLRPHVSIEVGQLLLL